ncbi:MAG: peptidase S41 [Burkholderiales bacterium]|nr:peptidase S41 [Burkholderiales bacterium]
MRTLQRPLIRIATAATLACLLASCGGGGSKAGSSPFDIGLPDSSTLAQQCAAPRPGDTQGSLATEKDWLRSWIDETYLWYQDVRALPPATLDPANSATPLDYFNKLKSPLLTASGKAKDEFHFIYPTPDWIALSQSGVSYGYGFSVALVDDTAPDRVAVVAFTDAGTPAAAAGIGRGAAILAVDGAAVADGAAATINAGLFPKAAGPHTFTLRDLGAASTRDVTLTAQQLASVPVQNVRTLPAPNQSVGYMLFNDHIGTSEAQLVAAINTLKAAAVTDLVLDIRYNGGGYLDIAAELAYMIAGPAITGGKFFERLNYNNRDPFNQSTSERTTVFHSTGQGFSVPTSQDLPDLGLSRVFVLTSGDTCSASEAIINGLRGAGVTVHQVGTTTCGKPYGFYPQDNCNTTYFAIQFQGVNFLGFGDYADGFVPSAACTVADDFTHPLGDPAENQLEVALGLRNTGACTVPTGTRAQALGVARSVGSGAVLKRTPERENRIYRFR